MLEPFDTTYMYRGKEASDNPKILSLRVLIDTWGTFISNSPNSSWQTMY